MLYTPPRALGWRWLIERPRWYPRQRNPIGGWAEGEEAVIIVVTRTESFAAWEKQTREGARLTYKTRRLYVFILFVIVVVVFLTVPSWQYARRLYRFRKFSHGSREACNNNSVATTEIQVAPRGGGYKSEFFFFFYLILVDSKCYQPISPSSYCLSEKFWSDSIFPQRLNNRVRNYRSVFDDIVQNTSGLLFQNINYV